MYFHQHYHCSTAMSVLFCVNKDIIISCALGGRMLREHTSSLLIMSNHKTHNKKPMHTKIYI